MTASVQSTLSTFPFQSPFDSIPNEQLSSKLDEESLWFALAPKTIWSVPLSNLLMRICGRLESCRPLFRSEVWSMGGIETLTSPWQTQGKGWDAERRRKHKAWCYETFALCWGHTSISFIIFHLTLCKLFERDISSLFSTFSPSISFSPCPFKFLSTVDVFVLGGEPRGSWCSVLGALGEGHPFSHWASHQWGLCGGLIKVWPWMLRLRWTHGGKTTVIWSGSMTGSLRNQDKEGWWGNGQGIWGRGPAKRRVAVGVMLAHSRRVIQRGRKECRRKGGKQELEGCWWGGSMELGLFLFFWQALVECSPQCSLS